MNPRTNPQSDRKLLFAVAGSVVAVAIGVAILAGLTARDESRAVTTVPARPVSAEPARREVPREVTAPTLVVETVSPPESADPGRASATPVVVVDPESDPWPEGLRAYASREYDVSAAYLAVDAARRPERAYTHYMLGLALWKAGRLDDGLDAMERSAALNGRSIRTFVNLARIRLERRDATEALLSAESALSIDDGSVAALYQKARALCAMDRIDEAIAVLERCVELDGGAGQAHNLLGLVRLRRGEWTSALSSLEIAAALLPDTAYAQNNYGLALERAGRFDEAAIAFRRATGVDPDHEAARVSLARVAGPASDDPDAAVEVATIALESDSAVPMSETVEARGVAAEPPSD